MRCAALTFILGVMAASSRPCGDLCFADGFLVGQVAASDGDQRTTVELYGDAGPVLTFGQEWVQQLVVTSVTPYTCLLTVAPSAWGSVKKLYR